MSRRVSFPVFFDLWAQVKGWDVPDFHYAICDWLENRDRIAVLEVFRGASKSTIVAVYISWKLYRDPSRRFLIQAADDDTAVKMSRDVREVLRRHPLTDGMLKRHSAEHMFWVNGSDDERNPSVAARGVMSNVTGSRADEIIFDDCEVPRNIQSIELREKLRARMSDATYILVPGGQILYIGTPHTFDSIYEEKAKDGAERLMMPLFRDNQRHENCVRLPDTPLEIPTKDIMVFHGKKALEPKIDWFIEDGDVVFTKSLTGTVDIYADCIWPERFNYDELVLRRNEAHSQNEWDSQYMLRAKPVQDMRLDPTNIKLYHAEPQYIERNGILTMNLGETRITFGRAYWDVSLGKENSDNSVLTWLLSDDAGNLYWHRAASLKGDIRQQCTEVARIAAQFMIPCVDVETNGVGGFVPGFLREALQTSGCAVREVVAKGKKNNRILGAIEPALSGGLIFAHESVATSGAFEQMREWIPAIKDQPDDYLDSLAGAALCAPVRIGRKRTAQATNVWRSATIVETLAEG